MSEEKLFCPQCKEWHPKTCFHCLPLDLRCAKCIPGDTAMVVHDQLVQMAGKEVSQIVAKAGDCRSLKPLERLLDGIYEEWGGCEALCKDAVSWAKDLGDNPRTRSHALTFIKNLLAIHAKVEKTRVEDDWNQLSRAEIEAKLTLKLTAILMDSDLAKLKKEAVKKLTGGSGTTLD